MTLNKMVVIGNLGGDPEMRYLPSGSPVTNFSVATNYRYKKADGEQVDEVEWFRVAVFGRQAEACNQYLSKGSKVYVEGRLSSRQWQGQDGQSRFSLEINADRVQFIDSRGQNGAGAAGSPPSQEDEDDSLPW